VHAAAAFDKAGLADLDLNAWRRVQVVVQRGTKPIVDALARAAGKGAG
jgi:hypothetical protein